MDSDRKKTDTQREESAFFAAKQHPATVEHWSKKRLVRALQNRAGTGVLRKGKTPTQVAVRRARQYIVRCTGVHPPSGSKLILTQDVDYHRCGYWKNPQYDSCLHLSLSFYDPATGEPAPKNEDLTDRWILLVFRDDVEKIWTEPPTSSAGMECDTWHYRLFFDPNGQPIQPTGEVYSRENTPAGWLSWSDRQAEKSEQRRRRFERMMNELTGA